MNINKTQFPPNDLRNTKPSLPCLPACQECRSVYPWGDGTALCSPAESSMGAALTTENARKPASSQRMSISLYPSKHQDDFIHGEKVQPSSSEGSNFSKNAGMKNLSGQQQVGDGRVIHLIPHGFY